MAQANAAAEDATGASSRPSIKAWRDPRAWLRLTHQRLKQQALFRILESVVEGYQGDRVGEQAAAMTYFGVFSLFPLLLLFISLAGLALQNSDQAREHVLDVVVGLLPQGQDALHQMIASVVNAKGAAAGVGILTLLWGALGWFQVVDTNINRIWGVDNPRSFFRGRLLALLMVGSVGGVGLVSWAATAVVGLLASYTQVIPGSVALWQLIVSVLSLLSITAVFFVLFRETPQRQVEMGDVWPAALTTAVIWEVTRRALAFYLERTDMITGYGPVGAAMALLFWIYVANTIILVGAEITYAVAKERRHISPGEELSVVAVPGEQPTPKFAPQVGQGFSTPQNVDEPVEREQGPDRLVTRGDRAHTPDSSRTSRLPRLRTPLVGAAGLALGFLIGLLASRRH